MIRLGVGRELPVEDWPNGIHQKKTHIQKAAVIVRAQRVSEVCPRSRAILGEFASESRSCNPDETAPPVGPNNFRTSRGWQRQIDLTESMLGCFPVSNHGR